MIYKEWIWTLRNWTSVAFPLGIAILIMGPSLANDPSPARDPYLPLVLVLTSATVTSGRLTEDFRTGMGAIYLRTPVHPHLQILTKWGFDSVVGILAGGATLIFFAQSGLSPLNLLVVALASGTLSATNMAIQAFAGQAAFLLRMLVFFAAFGSFGLTLPSALSFGIPPLTAFSGVRGVAFGRPSLVLAIVLAVQTAILVSAMAFFYRSLLLRRL